MVSHFFVTADVTPNKTQHERLKVAFSSMFLKRKKSHSFGASSFSKFHHTRQKNPFATLIRTVLHRAKNHFATGRNSERCSYHTDLSRFVLPISDPSH